MTLLWLALAVALAAVARGQEVDSGQGDDYGLEFRSVITLDGETHYSLHNVATGTSFWISENEVRHGVEIVQYSAAERVLTLYHDDELQELLLSPSMVAELEPEQQSTGRVERRRSTRQERRDEYDAFRQSWEAAAQNSAELSELEQEMRSLAAAFRETRSARRGAGRGTDERRLLREQEQAVHEELRLMAEYTALQAAHAPSFEGGEPDRMRRMLHRMAFSRTGGE